MFNKIKRAFSHSASTSHPGERKEAEVVGEDGSDEEEDATKVLDDKVKRTNTLKDKRKGRAKGPKNRRSPSKKKKPLFDRFLAKFHINKKEKKTEDTETVKVTTEEDVKASEVLNVVEKTEVLQRVERAPPPKNRRRPQRHNQRTEHANTRTSPVTKEIEDSLLNGANLVSVENDVNEADTQEETNKKFAAKDEKTKRKILTPKTFSMDREKEVDGKSKPPLPGKEKPLKEKQDSSANERRISEESMDSNPRHSASDEEDATKINLFSNVASELGMKLAKKDDSPLEDTGREPNKDNKIQAIEKPKLPTSKKPPKQEKPQIHTILEESESLDSTVSIEEQIHRLPDKNGNNINLHNVLATELELKLNTKGDLEMEPVNKTHENRQKEKPTLPLNKKPNRLKNEKLSEENSEPFQDPDTFSEKLSTTPVEENIHNALAAELQRKLSSKPQVENPKQRPNLPQKKKPITKDKPTNENLQNETNDTKEVLDKPNKPQIPSKQKPKKAVVNREDENEKSSKDEIIDLKIEDKENDNYNKETVERDLKYEPESQVKPQIPKTPTKDITLEIINQDDNNNENIGTTEHINQSIHPVTNGKNKAPVKPPRTKRRVQSSSEIPNDKEAAKRRTQSNSENKTLDKEIFPDFDIKKKVSFDEETNYPMTQSSVDSSTDNEDLSDLFDVFDQEFDDQIKSLPVSRKGSVISMSRSSVRSMSRGSTSSFREPEGIDEELTELLLEIANNELDMTIELNKIENNNSDRDENDVHEVKKTIYNKDLLDSKEDKVNKLDPIQKASEISYNNESNPDSPEKQEWIEDFIPSTKQILNPGENKEDDHMSKISKRNEAQIYNEAKKQNKDNTNMSEMTSEAIAKNITEDNKQYKEANLSKETSKAKESKISGEDTQQNIEDGIEKNISVKTNEARIYSDDKQNLSKIFDTNEENNSNEHNKQNKEDAIIISKTTSKSAKQRFDLGEGDIIQHFQKFYKSQQSQSEIKSRVDESQAIKAVDDGPLRSLHDNSKSAEASPGTSVSPENTATPNETAVPQSPSEGTRIPPGRPRPGRPTPPGKKPQLNRLRNQNIPRTKNETPKLDSPSPTSDSFALGTEPSFVNEKDPTAKKSTEENKVLVTNSTQHKQSVNKSDSSQTEYKQDTIYSNFQRPRAETHESSIKPPRAEMHRLQSEPGVTNRSTPPTTRHSPKHRHTTPQIYVELGGKAPKPTYIEPGQINQAGRERSDSFLRSSSPRKKNESKDKSDESQDDH